jgi:hypothetical protein
MEIHGFRDLIVFQKSYKLSLEVYKISTTFPKEGKIFFNRSNKALIPINMRQSC